MEEVKICKECVHYQQGMGEWNMCNSSKMSITDFVHGIKHCNALNPTGECPEYQAERRQRKDKQ